MTSAADNARGAVLMMLSMAAFTFNDACMKAVAADLPLFQAILIRGAMATVLLGILAWHGGALVMPMARDRWVIGWRTLAEVGATATFLTALTLMPIANVTAILQSLPLAITLAGALFLGEAVGWRRWGAILFGFAGVMMIVRPGTDAFDGASVLVLAAVAFVVVRDLSTRGLSPTAPSLLVALITAIAITVMGGLMTLWTGWQPMSADQTGLLAMASVLIIGGYLFGVMTMRVGDIAVVSPFRYSAIVWALILGVLVFGERPDAWMLTGSAIVVATGVYTFSRERALARR